MHETRTTGLAANRLRAAGIEVTTGVGKTGVFALLRSGDDPGVLLRADMDALPKQEETCLPYASDINATNDAGGGACSTICLSQSTASMSECTHTRTVWICLD